MASSLEDIVGYCDARTRRTAYKDAPAAFNGLQLSKDGEVTKIGAAVDAGLVPFRQAVAQDVDFLIVHHGIYWDQPRPMVGAAFQRVAALVRGGCALYSSHLPLDGHPEIGNNALIAAELGLAAQRPFMIRDGEPVGWIAPRTGTRAALREQLAHHYPGLVAIEFGGGEPREVAICSGSGNSAVPELRPAGVDTLVTGELREEWFNYAQENHLNLYLCGHYATEVHGIRALASEVAEKFGLPWVFLPTENPL